MAAVAWAFAGQLFIHRGMWAVMQSEGAALITGLEFYRREVNRRRSLLGRVLKWSFGPIILSIGVLILVLTGLARNLGRSGTVVLPFCTVAVTWVVAIFLLRSRSQRELQRENDELDKIEKGGSQ